MNNGWVKIYRQLLDNEHLANDNTACLLFIKLILVADKNTGVFTTGRFRLAELANEKPTTVYKVLKRLQKWGMIELSSNNKRTTIYLCNFKDFQQDSNNKVTTKGQQSNNKVTLNKNKEERIKNNIKSNSNEVRRVYDFYIEKFSVNENAFKLTPARSAKINARLRDSGIEMLLEAILRTSESDFHRGVNDRGWRANLDFIIRSYEQVEKLSTMAVSKQMSEDELFKIEQEKWLKGEL